MSHVDIHKAAERLCVKAEKLGLDNPTESMISDCLLDVVCNTLNSPVETAKEIDGCQDTTVMRMFRMLQYLSGPLAERIALDMDHKCKDHSTWYRKVKLARKLLESFNP